MKKIFIKPFLLILAVLTCILFTGTGSDAFMKPFDLFGRDLEIKGSLQHSLDVRTHRDVRDIQFSSYRTTLRVEAKYQLIKNNKFKISLYSLGHYYHDFAGSIDDHQRDAIRNEDAGSHALKNFRRTNEGEEMLKELYLDIRWGNWKVRMGKQIVSWGETAFFQVGDVINPLDVTNLKVWPDFDDLKVGLWMLRVFYVPPDWWQNISLELLFIFPDFETTRLPQGGTGLFFGGNPMPNNAFGKLLHHMEHDKPGNDWNNAEWGIRIRGITCDTDWNLFYFRSRIDDGLVNGSRGASQMLNAILGVPITDRIYRFPHYHIAGFSFSRAVAPIRSVIRGEIALNFKDFQYGSGPTASGIRTRKLLITALTIDRKIFIPWLTPWNRMRYLGASITWYHYALLGHKHDKGTGAYVIWDKTNRDSSKDTLSMMFDYGFYWDYILPTFQFAYDFNGTTTLAYILKYAPGDHWRFQVSYQQKNEQGRTAHMQDQMMFSIQYEF